MCLYSPASDGGGAFYWSLYEDRRYKGYRYRVNQTHPYTNNTAFAKNLFSSFCIYSNVWFAVCVLTATSMIIVCRKLNCGKLTLFLVICANLGIIFRGCKLVTFWWNLPFKSKIGHVCDLCRSGEFLKWWWEVGFHVCATVLKHLCAYLCVWHKGKGFYFQHVFFFCSIEDCSQSQTYLLCVWMQWPIKVSQIALITQFVQSELSMITNHFAMANKVQTQCK